MSFRLQIDYIRFVSWFKCNFTVKPRGLRQKVMPEQPATSTGSPFHGIAALRNAPPDKSTTSWPSAIKMRPEPSLSC
jgi:hypothetical protein